MNKKVLVFISLLVIASIVLAACGTHEPKYTGQTGTSDQWVCPDGTVLHFTEQVNTSVAEQRCNKPTSIQVVPLPQTGNETANNGYVCNATEIGTPVRSSGSCSWCTINYKYDPNGKNPGDVYIVSETAMSYSAGAYVYQYQPGTGFDSCIEGQPFYRDPGYRPVWK